jgi:hypothetical protein
METFLIVKNLMAVNLQMPHIIAYNGIRRMPNIYRDTPEKICYAARDCQSFTLTKGDAYDESSQHRGGIPLCVWAVHRAVCYGGNGSAKQDEDVQRGSHCQRVG